MKYFLKHYRNTLSAEKIRLDQLLVKRKLASSIKEAQALILAGYVIVNYQKETKSGLYFPDDSEIALTKDLKKYASRGALKLEGALAKFKINPAEKICLDIGASTGGFTEILLRKGAAKVYAFDVGYGQMISRLANDPRVIVKDRFNIKNILPEDIDFNENLFIVIDVSFISLKAILPALVNLKHTQSSSIEIVALLKPQFEAKESEIVNGIVYNRNAHFRIIKMMLGFIKKELFANIKGIISSPITGKEGNHEFFIWFVV